jgi:O-antigen/teichoic acid export membrane protein
VQGGVSLAFLPVIINYIGIDGYGKVSFAITVQIWVGIFDFGLTTALARRLAICRDGDLQQLTKRFDTFEKLFWIFGLAFLAGSFVVINILGISPSSFPRIQGTLSEVRVFLILTFQYWMVGFYSMALIGFGRNDSTNAIKTLIVIVQSVVAVSVFNYYSTSVSGYLATLMVANIIHIGLLIRFTNYEARVALTRRRVFCFDHIKDEIKFAFGVFSTNLLSSIVNHADKVVIYFKSANAEYAEYMIVYQIASVVSSVGVQSYFVIFPRIANILVRGQDVEKSEKPAMDVFWKILFSMATFFVGIGAHVIGFSKNILEFFNLDPNRLERLHSLFCILIATASINGVMVVLYSYQMAVGRSIVSLVKNVITCLIVVPFLWLHGSSVSVFELFPKTMLVVAIAHYFVEPIAVYYPDCRAKALRWFFYSGLVPIMCVVPSVIILRHIPILSGWFRIVGPSVSILISSALAFNFYRYRFGVVKNVNPLA